MYSGTVILRSPVWWPSTNTYSTSEMVFPEDQATVNMGESPTQSDQCREGEGEREVVNNNRESLFPSE